MMSLNYLAFKWPAVNWSYSWSEIWNLFFRILKSIYQAMNSLVIFDIGGAFSVSVWDLSVGVIVMGALINLFINFTQPTLPDKWESGTLRRAADNLAAKSYWKERLGKKSK